MKTEFIEILETKLEDFVGEILNDKQAWRVPLPPFLRRGVETYNAA